MSKPQWLTLGVFVIADDRKIFRNVMMFEMKMLAQLLVNTASPQLTNETLEYTDDNSTFQSRRKPFFCFYL